MGAHDTKRKNRSGQILIFGAIIIMLLVLSTAIAIQLSSTTYQSLGYTEVKEVIGNVKEDFQRALGNILSQTTQEYYQIPENKTPIAQALGNINFWMKTTIRALASKGAQMNFTVDQDFLQMDWYSVMTKGSSSISAGYTMDMPPLGFYGWKEDTLILLNMSISIFRIDTSSENVTGIDVMINREGGMPVVNLGVNNFQVQFFNLSTKNWELYGNKTLFNNGGGSYTIYLGAWESYSKYLKVWAQDTRGIIVGCFNSSPVVETNLNATIIREGNTVHDTANVTFPGFLIPSYYPVPTGYIIFSVQYPNGVWIPLGNKTAIWDSEAQQLYAYSDPFTPPRDNKPYLFQAVYSGDSFYSMCISDITANESLIVNRS